MEGKKGDTMELAIAGGIQISCAEFFLGKFLEDLIVRGFCETFFLFKFVFSGAEVYIQNAGSGSSSQRVTLEKERSWQSYSFHCRTRLLTSIVFSYLCFPGALRQAAIDDNLCAGDVASFFAGEEEGCVCDIPC
jgi:hypothetical protein